MRTGVALAPTCEGDVVGKFGLSEIHIVQCFIIRLSEKTCHTIEFCLRDGGRAVFIVFEFGFDLARELLNAQSLEQNFNPRFV